jgi:hypothetical protein
MKTYEYIDRFFDTMRYLIKNNLIKENIVITRQTLMEHLMSLSSREWGILSNLHRLHEKPKSVRIKCPFCRHEFGLISYKIHPNEISHLDVLMALCTGCGRIIYWVGWPDEQEELKKLHDLCDQELENLKP